MQKHLCILLTGLILTSLVTAQEEDGLINNLEEMASEGQEAEMPVEIFEDLSRLRENPLNLNLASRRELENISLLSDYQISHLIQHREKYGDLLSYNEILAIPGFNSAILDQIRTLITLGDERIPSGPVPSKTHRIKGSLIGRYSRNFFHSLNQEETGKDPGHLGSPDRYYLRTMVNIHNRISAGFLAEKDAGEPFLPNEIPDSLKKLRKPGFDFYTGFIAVNNLKCFRSIILGDFHVQTGQGLTLWTSNHWSSPALPSQIMKRGQGLKASASSEENRLMRGIATTVGLGKYEITAFYSHMKRDANVTVMDKETGHVQEISSLQESGYHRNAGEIADRDVITMKTWGLYVRRSGSWYKAGLTATGSMLSASLARTSKPSNQFRFSGRSTQHAGIDWMVKPFKATVCTGEFTLDGLFHWAILQSITVFLPRIEFSILYRNFSKKFDNLLNNPYRSGSGGSEWGIYAGLLLHLKASWTLNAHSDLAWFPWLRFGVDAPSQSRKFRIALDHRISQTSYLGISARYAYKETNSSSPHEYIHSLANQHTLKMSLGFACAPDSRFSIRNRLELNMIQTNNAGIQENTSGASISQDILYRPEKKAINFTFRWMLFDTDDYESRIYQYEHDVLYAFSVPASYGSGFRAYFLTRISLSGKLDTWIKSSVTQNLRKPKSSEPVLTGKALSWDLRIQVRLKL